MKRARYEIVRRDRKKIVIKDLGPWDKHKTITNDAETVVQDLVSAGILEDGMRLFYYDTEGNRDEILVEDGKYRKIRIGQPGLR